MNDIIPQDDTPLKRCNKCQKFKLRTPENFGPDKRAYDGFRYCCRDCRRIEHEEALAHNPNMHKDRYEKERHNPEKVEKRRVSASTYARNSRKRNALAGLCIECGMHPCVDGSICDQCKIAQRQRRNKRSDHYLALAKKSRDKLRNEVLKAYGSKCACCGEIQPEFLAVDHINNDGAEHRRTVGTGLYQWLRKNGFPKEVFQLLCHNCNFAKAKYGVCPHQKNS